MFNFEQNKKPVVFTTGLLRQFASARVSKKGDDPRALLELRRSDKNKNPNLYRLGVLLKRRRAEPLGEHVVTIKNKKACLFRQAFH